MFAIRPVCGMMGLGWSHARPEDMARLWWACARLAEDSHSVVQMRVLGMSGAHDVADDENDRMVREKVSAFTESFLNGTFATLSGNAPTQVMRASLEPLSDAARSNRARLSGPMAARADVAPLPSACSNDGAPK